MARLLKVSFNGPGLPKKLPSNNKLCRRRSAMRKGLVLSLVAIGLVVIYRSGPLAVGAAKGDGHPKEAAYRHFIRLKVLEVTPVEKTDRAQLVELKVQRWYGKIEAKSLKLHEQHESQQFTLLFPAAPDAVVRVGDIIDYRLEGYLALPSSAMAEKGRSQQASPAKEAPARLDWESANAKRMFILVSNGSAVSAISVDTTHIEDLRAALNLQELVFRISGIRMPIVDKQYVTVPWGMIHIRWDHSPMVTHEHAFEISMKEADPDSANPPKQVIIAGSRGAIDSAVSAFTEDAFGIPLNALDDKEYKWRQTKTVALPEKMKTIFGGSGGN
jgi:hypothetical protein